RTIEKEEILQQVMDMMLQAQIENKSMNLVVGEDYKEFCKSIIEEYREGKSKFYWFLNYLQKYLIWMVLITLFMVLVNGMSGITVNQFLLVNMITLISIPVSKKDSQENASTAPLPLYKRIYFRRDLTKSAIWILIAGIVMMLFSYIIEDKLGLSFTNYKISFSAGITYPVIIFLIIGAIEIYKRIADMKQQL
ncbi:MAG: hypothetical protein WCQ54_09195, partial [Clostridiaceae bacterium]